METIVVKAAKADLWRALCAELGVETRLVDPADLSSGALRGAKLLVLPALDALPVGKLGALRAFAEGGGRLFVADRLTRGVGEILGVEETGRLASSNWLVPVFNRLRRRGAGLDGMPEVTPFVFEKAEATLVRPAGEGEVVATWGLDDADLALPGLVLTPRGLFAGMTWERGATAEQLSLADAILSALLPSANATRAARAAARERAGRARLASIRVPPPAPGERRGIWANGRSRLFRCGPGWDAAVRFVAENGITDLCAIMAWGGASYYPSAVLEESSVARRHGDQLAQCVEACRRHGVRFHARKICHRLDPAMVPEAVRDRMAAEGRVQVAANGERSAWLCPTDPGNRAREVAACVEIARRGVDGVQLDFIRYDHGRYCFCDGCRRRFATKHGLQPRWPDDVLPGGRYVEEWRAFRIAEITETVRAIREGLRREAPGVEFSACVFPYFFSGRGSFDPSDDPGFLHDHIAQDWVRWAEEGLVDYVLPMNYQDDMAAMRLFVTRQMDALGPSRDRCLSGVGLRNQPAAGPLADAARLLENVALMRELSPKGFVLFTLDLRAEGALPLVGRALREGQA